VQEPGTRRPMGARGVVVLGVLGWSSELGARMDARDA
jgi:hypothetical protein